MASGIYCLVNTTNGKRYVGSSKNIAYRTSRHLGHLKAGAHCNGHMQSAWNLGQRFAVQILEVCDEVVLVEREQFFIDKYGTCDKRRGYNLTIAGRTIPSEEGRKRISASRKGKTWEEIYGVEEAARLREEYSMMFGGEANPRYGVSGELHPFFGKTMADVVGEETAAKMAQATSDAMAGREVLLETRAKISKARKGKALSDMHKQAIGEGGQRHYKLVGPRTFEQKYGEERAAEIKAKIAGSVSKAGKGKKKSQAWIDKMKSRRCPITGKLLPKVQVNA